MIPRVADISHHNVVTNFGKAAEAGLWGIIHKASQGRAYVDPTYGPRRPEAVAAGLLWGAYHFNTGDPVDQQVDNFMHAANPDASTLMVLDYEDNRLSQMSIHQAIEFLHLLEQRLGRKGAIYSGNRVKETIDALDAGDKAYLCAHRLWLCQYGPHAVLPHGWSKYWLWQYTGDGIGPTPHWIAGIQGSGIDLNTYAGTREQFIAEWS
jgi:lysozyme